MAYRVRALRQGSPQSSQRWRAATTGRKGTGDRKPHRVRDARCETPPPFEESFGTAVDDRYRWRTVTASSLTLLFTSAPLGGSPGTRERGPAVPRQKRSMPGPWRRSTLSSTPCVMNALEGRQGGGRSFPRNRESGGRGGYPPGRINWGRTSWGRFERRTLSHS